MSSIIDFGKMSHAEKKVWLKNIFLNQREMAKENIKDWLLVDFLSKLDQVYSNHENQILEKLCDKKTKTEALKIVLNYF